MPPLRVVGLLVALSELGNQAIMLDRTAVLGFAVELRAHGAPPVAGGMNRFSRRGAQRMIEHMFRHGSVKWGQSCILTARKRRRTVAGDGGTGAGLPVKSTRRCGCRLRSA
jgi:hypothetical protein